MIAVIRIRGTVGLRPDARKAMEVLKLKKINTLAILEDNPSMEGIVQTVKDYVTWGRASDETLKALAELTVKGEKVKYYHLHPPRGGHKGSIKWPFPKGELGKRGEKINELIMKMLP